MLRKKVNSSQAPIEVEVFPTGHCYIRKNITEKEDEEMGKYFEYDEVFFESEASKEEIEADLPYEIKCPALLICGDKDHAGFCIRYNKEWHKRSGIKTKWIKGAGHNSNTDEPEQVNTLIERFVKKL